MATASSSAAQTAGGPGDIAYMLFSNVYGSRCVRFARMPPTGKLLGELTPMRMSTA
ncbi:hypothetical protein P3T24_000587 [Paraburkholderia sp. GAS33]|jgi:hypothetical protein